MWPWPRMIAHRGGGKIAPENTLAGMAAAVRAGYRAVEFDVMLGADGVPVLMHDEMLGRTVAGRGRVAALPSPVLCAMDAGSWFGPQFAGERVPLYRDALAYCLRHGLWMNVELKPAAGFESATGATVARLTREWLGDEAGGQVLFSSFSTVALEAARAAAPAIPRGWLLDRVPAGWQQRAQALQVRSLHLNHRRLDAVLAAQVLSQKLGLFCYTVNTPAAVQRLMDLKVDAICTDRSDLFPAHALDLSGAPLPA